MSTRGATGFIADGKWYVTYNHSDSYPEWLGMRVLEFCKTEVFWNKVKENVKKVILVNEDAKPTKKEIKAYSDFSDTKVGLQTLESWYCLLRGL